MEVIAIFCILPATAPPILFDEGHTGSPESSSRILARIVEVCCGSVDILSFHWGNPLLMFRPSQPCAFQLDGWRRDFQFVRHAEDLVGNRLGADRFVKGERGFAEESAARLLGRSLCCTTRACTCRFGGGRGGLRLFRSFPGGGLGGRFGGGCRVGGRWGGRWPAVRFRFGGGFRRGRCFGRWRLPRRFAGGSLRGGFRRSWCAGGIRGPRLGGFRHFACIGRALGGGITSRWLRLAFTRRSRCGLVRQCGTTFRGSRRLRRAGARRSICLGARRHVGGGLPFARAGFLRRGVVRRRGTFRGDRFRLRQ